MMKPMKTNVYIRLSSTLNVVLLLRQSKVSKQVYTHSEISCVESLDGPVYIVFVPMQRAYGWMASLTPWT